MQGLGITKFTLKPDSHVFTVMLGLLAVLPALSIDISAPTLSLLPEALSTSTLVAGLTLSLFLAGFAIGQLGGGIVSDHHGRKPVLLTGFATYIAAGMACALASSGIALVAFRFTQGIGAGTCAAMSFAMVQDLFQGTVARSKRAYVTMVLGAAPIVAPALGSLIVELAGWRAVHGILALGGVVLLVVVWRWLAESHKALPPTVMPSSVGLGPMLKDRRFVALAVVNALSYGAVFAYIAGSPVIVMRYYHGTAGSYSALFACTAIAFSAGDWTSGRLTRRGTSAVKFLSVALPASAAASLALVSSCLASPAVSGPVAAFLLTFLQFCRGAIAPNLQHLAIERQRQRAGTASAAVGVTQLLGGILSSVVVAGLLSGFELFAVAGPVVLCSTGALALWRWVTVAESGIERDRSDIRVSG